jgi:hypothetical protein
VSVVETPDSEKRSGTASRIYRVTFLNQGNVYEVFAREVSQGGLFGFIEVAGLMFGERSQVVIDPSEESLKTEFEGVERFYVPMHSVVRIDEVRRGGAARIVARGDSKAGTVAHFPVPMYPPPGGSGPTGGK